MIDEVFMSVYIDGRYYYSPCEKCKEDGCYSCALKKYKEDLESERDRDRKSTRLNSSHS